MPHVQLQLTEEQAAHLLRRAAANDTSIDDAIREAIDAQLAADERARRIEVALAVVDKAAFRSDGQELVSVSELAARCGRSVNTIQSWRRRHADFPAPRVELAAGPIWLLADVRTWIEERSKTRKASARS